MPIFGYHFLVGFCFPPNLMAFQFNFQSILCRDFISNSRQPFDFTSFSFIHFYTLVFDCFIVLFFYCFILGSNIDFYFVFRLKHNDFISKENVIKGSLNLIIILLIEYCCLNSILDLFHKTFKLIKENIIMFQSFFNSFPVYLFIIYRVSCFFLIFLLKYLPVGIQTMILQ